MKDPAMHPISIPRSAVLLAGLWALGCGGAEKPSVGSSAAVPVRSARLTLRIGDESGGPATFGRVSGVTVDESGRIYAADSQADEMRVFAADGHFLFSIGRRGGGPGELSSPCCLAFDAAGRLWVRDGGNARYDVFSVREDGADYLWSVRMAHGDVNFWAPTRFDAEGHLVDIGHRSTGRGLVLVHFYVDSAGSVVDSVPIPATPMDSLGVRTVESRSGGRRSIQFFYPPFGPLELVAHGPGGEWAKALSSRYRVAWHDAHGALLHVIQVEGVSGPPVSAGERAAAEKRIAADADRYGLSGANRFSVPDRKQPLSGIFFDERGRLWVQRTAAAGANPTADVWSRDGALLSHVEWPAGVDLRQGTIGDSSAVGVAVDSLGAQSVVRLSWH